MRFLPLSFTPDCLIASSIATRRDSIVLDSFAGSGTTAHAVLAANRKDDGNRRVILVEMEDYADRLTAERLRLAIASYKLYGNRTGGID